MPSYAVKTKVITILICLPRSKQKKQQKIMTNKQKRYEFVQEI